MDFLLGFFLVGLLCFSPYLLTRLSLTRAAQSWPDPRRPEAARSVRWVAGICVTLTVVAALAFFGWCTFQAENYEAGPGFDIGQLLWQGASLLGIVPVLQVLLAVAIPVRVKLPPSADSYELYRPSRR